MSCGGRAPTWDPDVCAPALAGKRLAPGAKWQPEDSQRHWGLTQRAHCCTPRKKPDAPPYMDFWDESLKCNTPGNIAFSSPLASPVSYSWAKFLRPVDPGGWVVWESSWSSFCPKSRGRTGCAVRDSGRRTQAWERCPKPTGTGNQLSYLNDHAADICIPKGWYF